MEPPCAWKSNYIPFTPHLWAFHSFRNSYTYSPHLPSPLMGQLPVSLRKLKTSQPNLKRQHFNSCLPTWRHRSAHLSCHCRCTHLSKGTLHLAHVISFITQQFPHSTGSLQKMSFLTCINKFVLAPLSPPAMGGERGSIS